jgi:hypothetical protein
MNYASGISGAVTLGAIAEYNLRKDRDKSYDLFKNEKSKPRFVTRNTISDMQEEGIVYQYSQKAIRASTYKSES